MKRARIIKKTNISNDIMNSEGVISLHRIKIVSSTINYIEEHLTEKIDLDEVAKAVYYSKYHLHRIFKKTIGITIHDYIQRRQLTEAAKLLVFSNRSILDVALSAGYESQQAFTSIFKAMYKKSPLQFRESEEYYPLQLRYELNTSSNDKNKRNDTREIVFASEKDIKQWMHLVRLVIDGFPNLIEKEHVKVLRKNIAKRQALIMNDNGQAIGIMMINYKTGSIDFLGVHPLYRKQGVSKELLNKAIAELLKHKNITITTFREGDKADIGHRRDLKELGFAEAELLIEFGYPTQKMIFQSQED